MTTLVRPEGRTDDDGSTSQPPREPSRYAAWRASWAVALRMARRDVRRHRGRSALVVVMVALPTLLLSLVVTLAATTDVSGVEAIPATMGTGQALVEGPDGARFLQGADPNTGSSGSSGEARAIPGFSPGGTTADNAEAISRLVGDPVAPISTFGARTTVGERRVSVQGLALDGRLGLGERLELVSGRWPVDGREALVTGYGTSRGLPDRGRLTVTVNGVDHTYEIVGVASSTGRFGPEGLVVPEPPTGAAADIGGWIVRGAEPVTWADVRRLNEYGLRVSSAAVLRDPPRLDELPAEIRDTASGDASQMQLLVGLGAAMLLITTALLVGPAFAVSAARQRRTLALAASNGASTPVLRRTVLAQALVLGSASAVVGTVLGVTATPLVIAWTNRDGFDSAAPLDLRWGLLTGIALCAVASTMVAALSPARRLGRLDIVGVMRGQSVSPQPSMLVLAAGVGLALLGAVVVLGSTGAAGLPSVTTLLGIQAGGEFAVTIGAVVLILGALFLVPVALAGVGRLGRHLPTTLRMAARDLARHRARSAPSVAAVLAAVAGLTFGLTGLASDTEQSRRAYTPTTLAGEGIVSFWMEPVSADAVRAAAPGLVVTENRAFDTQDPMMDGEAVPTEPYRVGFVNVVPPGCTAARTVQDDEWLAQVDAGYRAAEAAGTLDTFDPGVAPCSVGGTTFEGSGQILLLPADEVVRRLGLDAGQADAVRAGAVVTREMPPAATSGNTVTLARGTSEMDPQATGPTDARVDVEQQVELPLVALPRSRETEARMLGASLVLAAGTATTAEWPTRPVSLTVRDPSGAPVLATMAERLQEVLGDEVGVSVESGFERDDALVVGILLGVFAVLILVITLTSTALTLAEQQTDQATLAALGATRGTRRLMAASAAFLLAAVGCVLGVAVGLVPGIAIARPLTSQGWDSVTGVPVGQDTVLVVPWLQLAVVAVLVPLVAGAMAWAGIRRAPQVTRRTT
ncbi:MAG TPA: FtsX-like permease family protein [Ornithinibacter sp.]|nr:FtsX-like permease family protein [Ornithinibacter sp.]